MNKVSKVSSETRGHAYFHPSSFGECLRKVAFEYYSEIDPWFKVPDEIEPRLQRLFQAGHNFHDRMQSEFADMGVLRGYWKSKITGKIYGKESKTGIFRPKTLEEIGEEKYKHPDDKRPISNLFEYQEIQVFDEEANFRGHCDGVVELIEGDPEFTFVVDFKTINEDKFKMLKEPDPKYVVQITIYMEILGLDKGVIYYEDKNRHERKEFLVLKDKEIAEEIFSNARKLKGLLDLKKIPPIPSQFSEDRPPCRWCKYAEKCKFLSEKSKNRKK